MNPYGRNEKRLDTYLSQLLWAIAHKFNGEFRLDSDDLDAVPEKCAIVTDWDSSTHELVIRATTGQSEMVAINTEQQWARTSSTSESGQSRGPRSNSEVPRAALLTEEDMARIEMNLLGRARKRQLQKEDDEAAELRRRPQQ